MWLSQVYKYDFQLSWLLSHYVIIYTTKDPRRSDYIRLDMIGPNGLSYPNMFLVGYPISHNIGGLYQLLVQHHQHDEPLGFGFVTLAHDWGWGNEVAEWSLDSVDSWSLNPTFLGNRWKQDIPCHFSWILIPHPSGEPAQSPVPRSDPVSGSIDWA